MDDQTWPFETPRDEMLARVVTRGRRIQMINRTLIGVAVAGAIAVGAAGFVVGFSGGSSTDASVAPAGVGYHACPESGVIGELGGGDRVFLTGTDESGGWVQLRSPQSASSRVWIPAEAVDPDEAVDLLVVDCAPEEFEMAMADITPSTEDDDDEEDDEGADDDGDDADEPDVTTTTTAPGSTPTTPGTTPTPTTPGTTPTTTASTPTTQGTTPTTPTTQAPQPAPTMTSISVSPTPMIRRYPQDPGWCEANWVPNGSEISTVRAHGVSNADSVTWVARIGGQQIGQGSMSQSFQVPGQWQGQIGPFAQAGQESPQQVTVMATATGPGGSVNRQTSFTLNDCYIG